MPHGALRTDAPYPPPQAAHEFPVRTLNSRDFPRAGAGPDEGGPQAGYRRRPRLRVRAASRRQCRLRARRPENSQARTPAVPWCNRTLAGRLGLSATARPPPRHLGGYVCKQAIGRARLSPARRRTVCLPRGALRTDAPDPPPPVHEFPARTLNSRDLPRAGAGRDEGEPPPVFRLPGQKPRAPQGRANRGANGRGARRGPGRPRGRWPAGDREDCAW